jgi:replicative DNA helicase
MDYLRQFADAGTAVIVISAIGRTKDSKGRSSYDGEGLSLASFRESSELEFGCDDAFILTPDDDTEGVTLRHLKSRHGETKDLSLTFNRQLQRFTPSCAGPTARPDAGKMRSALAALWDRTAPARDDAEGGGGE